MSKKHLSLFFLSIVRVLLYPTQASVISLADLETEAVANGAG